MIELSFKKKKKIVSSATIDVNYDSSPLVLGCEELM